jgi:hypothetical protein
VPARSQLDRPRGELDIDTVVHFMEDVVVDGVRMAVDVSLTPDGGGESRRPLILTATS